MKVSGIFGYAVGIMQTLTRQIIEADFTNRVVFDHQLARILPGSSQSRHNLVNRALKAGELIRLKRGAYVLAEP